MSLDILGLEKSVKNTFGAHCNTGLFTSKIHILHHIIKDLEKFGNLNI